MKIPVDSKDYADLKTAVRLLETPTITERISRVIGSPIEFAIKNLPKGAEKTINELVTSALHKASSAALWSLDNEPGKRHPQRLISSSLLASVQARPFSHIR
jgi:hypothetical protein